MSNLNAATADCDTCNRKVRNVCHNEDLGLAQCDKCYAGETPNRATRRKQVHTSHAECDHPKTPVARAKCRKARAKALVPAPEVNADAPADDHFGDTESDYDSEALSAFKALTDKQREQAREALRANGIEGGTVDSDARVVTLTLALVDRARAKKTTVAKLSKADLKNVIAIDSL